MNRSPDHPIVKPNLKYLCLILLGWLTMSGQPRWATNLTEAHGFQPFDRPTQLLWSKQQGIVFITPDRLAVYQVNELRSPAPLAKRDGSGGAGNFVLNLKILDAHDGREIKSMRFPT